MIVINSILNKMKYQKGFTLIELITVVGILAVLLSVVIVAINPARQFAEANDTKRKSDVKAILDAIEHYASDNAGNISLLNITTTPHHISSTETGLGFCTALVPTYIAALPSDPTRGTGASSNGTKVKDCNMEYNTNYSVFIDSSNQRITVHAEGEITDTITVIR
jgi:prepilin-type N-terminal cleavage/methylation domain-containing protein